MVKNQTALQALEIHQFNFCVCFSFSLLYLGVRFLWTWIALSLPSVKVKSEIRRTTFSNIQFKFRIKLQFYICTGGKLSFLAIFSYSVCLFIISFVHLLKFSGLIFLQGRSAPNWNWWWIRDQYNSKICSTGYWKQETARAVFVFIF